MKMRITNGLRRRHKTEHDGRLALLLLFPLAAVED